MEMMQRERSTETGMVYRGACDLIHIADGERANTGRELAETLSRMMRVRAYESGARTFAESRLQNLCPGCYMVAGFNMMRELAKQNGQSMRELGRSMARAFDALADAAERGEDPADLESIVVRLDSEGDAQAKPRVLEVG